MKLSLELLHVLSRFTEFVRKILTQEKPSLIIFTQHLSNLTPVDAIVYIYMTSIESIGSFLMVQLLVLHVLYYIYDIIVYVSCNIKSYNIRNN